MSNNNVQVKLEELNSLTPIQIVENQKVENKFVQMYDAIWGSNMGMQIYHKEVFNFQKLIKDKPDLALCSKLSLYGCFLDMAVNGLSLDSTSHPQCYLIPRSVKTGYKDQNGRDIYERRANVSVTGYGELMMRMRAGQIRYADNPVVVYEGDTFAINLDHGLKRLTYSAAIPRKSSKIIGAFIRIVRTDGSEDYQWLLEGDIKRLAGFSEKNNSYYDKTGHYVQGKANRLYTSQNGGIDPGFLENKMIKHAFDAYPKVRTGKYTLMETEEDNQEIDYGIEEQTQEEQPQEPKGFGPQEPEPATVEAEVSQADEDEGF
jgi:hypothetical protein